MNKNSTEKALSDLTPAERETLLAKCAVVPRRRLPVRRMFTEANLGMLAASVGYAVGQRLAGE